MTKIVPDGRAEPVAAVADTVTASACDVVILAADVVTLSVGVDTPGIVAVGLGEGTGGDPPFDPPQLCKPAARSEQMRSRADAPAFAAAGVMSERAVASIEACECLRVTRYFLGPGLCEPVRIASDVVRVRERRSKASVRVTMRGAGDYSFVRSVHRKRFGDADSVCETNGFRPFEKTNNLRMICYGAIRRDIDIAWSALSIHDSVRSELEACIDKSRETIKRRSREIEITTSATRVRKNRVASACEIRNRTHDRARCVAASATCARRTRRAFRPVRRTSTAG